MDKRKRNVILTAKELFATKGYRASSVQDIYEACHISKGTFYNYFASKNDFLIAYLNMARDEEFARRDKMVRKEDKANKDIFTQQILVRIEVMSEFSLRPIFEAAFHSEDKDLKSYINGRLVEELSWLAGRFVEIYGEQSIPYVSDCAVIMHGMIQNMLYAWKTITKGTMNLTLLVQYVIRRMDAMMDNLIGSNDTLLEHQLFYPNQENDTKQKLLTTLMTFRKSLGTKDMSLLESTEFIVEEIQRKQPRLHLLNSFIELFNKNTENYGPELNTISAQIKEFINNEKNCLS